MTHYRMLDHAPSCAILHNKNELKVYQGNQVYLNDGDNFELRFFNPTSFKLGIEIMFNGIKKGDGYLVLNPGQDIILDRFLDEQRKMLFETYVIDGNNSTSVKAVEQNGIISFNFYKEYYNYNNWYYIPNGVNVNYDFPPRVNNIPTHNSNIPYTINNNFYSGTYTSSIFDTPDTYYGTTRTGLAHFKNVSSSYNCKSSTLKSSCCDNISFESKLNKEDFNPIETGRIEKGEISSQTLKNVNAQFQSLPFHSITYKIMPTSSMNKTVKEVRVYCNSCGYRLRKGSWEFCPSCGNKIN